MICISSTYNPTIMADFQEESKVKNKLNTLVTDGHIETIQLMHSANQLAGLTMSKKVNAGNTNFIF